MPPSPPFFIVGAQRSGTTMLRLMLNAHARIAVPFESDFLAVARGLNGTAPFDATVALEALAADPWTAKGGIVEDRAAILARRPASFGELAAAAFGAWAAARGKPCWGVKTPGYVTELDALWAMFPGARFVHIVRDGRDVALSLRDLSWGSRHVLRVAADWRWKTLVGRKMGAMVPGHYHELRYEDLIADPGATLRGVCDFLGVEFDAGMLEYHREAPKEMPQESLTWHRSSVSAPDVSKARAWKTRMSTADRILFEDVAGDALALFGYEVEGRTPTLASRARQLYFMLIKRW
jgi:hypothetical protein